jgi:gas vesicle protein
MLCARKYRMLKSIGLPELIVLALVGFVIFKGSNFVRGCAIGVLLGAFVGFLMRPNVPIVGQLPFGVVLTRGSYLTGVDTLVRSSAEQSFNYMLVGAIIGAVVLGAIAKSGEKTVARPLSSVEAKTRSLPTEAANEAAVAEILRGRQSTTVSTALPTNKFCTKCGNTFLPEIRFCGICGNRR